VLVVEPGTEVELLRPLPVGVIPGVGPVTQDRLRRIGISTVSDLQQIEGDELAQVIGHTHGEALRELAFARDDRPIQPERETKSISVEDTFETDLADPAELLRILDRDASQVAVRLRAARLFARTVTIKVRRHDFVTYTRSRTLPGATDRPQLISEVARSLLVGVDIAGGVRLLGVGVAGFTDAVQEDLFVAELAEDALDAATTTIEPDPVEERRPPRWVPGADVEHEEYGRGWVWGVGLGRVTVRFESRDTPPGPIRTFPVDDPKLRLISVN
jgi:DNA polymerase-4